MKNRIILASSSPRRKELLENVGIKFEVLSPLSDESILDYENPKDYVIRLAEEKALSVAQLQGDKSFIIGSDTIVLVDDDILGKPFNEEE
ncbi:MAG: nucleoside triphosphate pyrophosphatase, partial [Candidatus Dadabacteria bacterium]